MMNDPVLSSPTLLSLTAPKRRESSSSAPEQGFAEELEAAGPRKSTERSEKSSGSEKASADPTDRAESAESPQPEDEIPARDTPADDSTPEEDLLVVSIAIETLVLETPPDVQLPEVASTTLEVSLDSSLKVAPPVATGDLTPVDTSRLSGVDAAILVSGEDFAALSEPASTTIDLPATGVESSPLPTATEAPTEIVDETAPQLDTVETTEAVSSSPALIPEDYEATPPSTVDAEVVPVALENDSESSDGDEGDTNSERPKPVAPLPLPVANATTDASEATTEPTTDRASVPTVSGTGESRPSAAIEAANQRAAEPTPTIDPTRFVSRVAKAFGSAQERGGGPIEIRLSPPELGSMQVRIELKEGVMTASLDVETPAARNALLDNLPALRDRLEQQQIRIESFDVNVRDDSGQRGGDWQPSSGSSDERSEDHREPSPQAATTPTDSTKEGESSQVPTIHFGDEAINVVA